MDQAIEIEMAAEIRPGYRYEAPSMDGRQGPDAMPKFLLRIAMLANVVRRTFPYPFDTLAVLVH